VVKRDNRSKDQYKGSQGSTGRSGVRQRLQALPNSYFLDDDRESQYLCPDFVSKATIDPLAKCFGHGTNPRLTTRQIRRFFNHCREIERRLRIEGDSWEQVAADFEKISSQAQYAKAGQKIPGEFAEFIDNNVKRVISSNNPELAFLNGFMQHFEALVGFGAAYMKDR